MIYDFDKCLCTAPVRNSAVSSSSNLLNCFSPFRFNHFHQFNLFYSLFFFFINIFFPAFNSINSAPKITYTFLKTGNIAVNSSPLLACVSDD